MTCDLSGPSRCLVPTTEEAAVRLRKSHPNLTIHRVTKVTRHLKLLVNGSPVGSGYLGLKDPPP